jgi:hypothetical protein
MKGLPEVELPPTDAFPIRRGYTDDDPKPYTELSLDGDGRLAQVELFASPERQDRLVLAAFSNWREPKPGLLFPCLQRTTFVGPGGKTIQETVRVSALTVNEAIDASRFTIAPVADTLEFMTVEEMSARLAEREKK